MESAGNSARGVAWDLADLYASPADPALSGDLEEARRRAEAFARRYRGTIDVPGGPPPDHLAAAVAEYEAIAELAAKPGAYAQLLHAADSRPPGHGALVALTQERGSAVRTLLLFFELEWLALPDAAAQPAAASEACRRHRHFLETLRRYKPHTLSEPEERVLEEKANTSTRAFNRLFDDLLGSLQFEIELDGGVRQLNESAALALLSDSRRPVRRAAASSLTAGLRTNHRVLTFIFNTLVNDHAIEDRLRGYTDPMQARHLANQIDAATVGALVDACEGASPMVASYYELKRAILGLDRLYDYDRYAPLFAADPLLSWSDCRDLVLDAYRDFSPRAADIASDFFARRWIDAEPRDGKRGGAFSASTVPAVHPYVMVNYTGRARDAMTVAHELGHAVHQSLARPQGYLQCDTPLTMAETASVFGEMLVFDRLRRMETDPRQRLALLCEKLEESFATVFRQITLTRFEEALHRARRGEGELSPERIGDLWMAANAAMYGDGVTLTDDYRWWWAYISHFVHAPFYCYAYGFGELLVLALYELYQQEGAAFVPRYLDMLAAGGSASPTELLRRMGIHVETPDVWQRGLGVLQRLLAEASALATDLGLCAARGGAAAGRPAAT